MRFVLENKTTQYIEYQKIRMKCYPNKIRLLLATYVNNKKTYIKILKTKSSSNLNYVIIWQLIEPSALGTALNIITILGDFVYDQSF